ncbi:MAG: ASCH domain-containing protein [Alphaproteobacteria bacterium]|nr:ASCH domain-containing protein [Alphaproteobacteria bacterium]
MNTLPLFKRDVLVSIRPIYASKILSGDKTVELRRKFPEAAIGATALIYATSPVQAIVGYARIKDILRLPIARIWREHGAAACIEQPDFDAYFDGMEFGFAVLLEGVQVLERPVNARVLRDEFGIVPPQSFRYLDEGYAALLSNEQVQISDRHQHRHRTGGRSARFGFACRTGQAQQ